MIQPIKTRGTSPEFRQLDLFYRRMRREMSIDDRFRVFHANNPHVYALVRRFAFEAKQSGRAWYSMDAIFHRVRWHLDVETRSADPFKMNNDFTSRYARLLMTAEPELHDFFELRTIRRT